MFVFVRTFTYAFSYSYVCIPNGTEKNSESNSSGCVDLVDYIKNLIIKWAAVFAQTCNDFSMCVLSAAQLCICEILCDLYTVCNREIMHLCG